ncbi:hypothetical protein [Saccharothrix sp. Mg75]|uniref:hypothetical protein n=1 Tax=Saccharothrix sp. Mg75 TaxID=3445357 RepID=UPI003EEEA064
MRGIGTSVGTLIIAGLFTAGPVAPASAASGTLYVTQNGRTTTHANPPARACIASDSTKGNATFHNRTDTVGYIFDATKCTSEHFTQRFLHRGETLTLPAGYTIYFP